MIDPSGEVVAEAPLWEPHLLIVDIDVLAAAISKSCSTLHELAH